VLLQKIKNFCYICYIVVVIEKYKYNLFSLLHLKVTNIYIFDSLVSKYGFFSLLQFCHILII